jgi:hypothetical protein
VSHLFDADRYLFDADRLNAASGHRALCRAGAGSVKDFLEVTKRYEPLSGLAYAQLNERTVRIKDKRTGTARPFPLWRLRSGLCCRPSIQFSGVASPQARIATQHSTRLFGSAFFRPDPHCLTLCDPFATYCQVSHSPVSTICRCITIGFGRLIAARSHRLRPLARAHLCGSACSSLGSS